ncbi:DUF4374 domain-containing protein [Sphingobacterium paucimobilis]|uniref:DUF4374 domain-containing protein n=1 Tax=Sphingobacterium paucimobilis HER1398 TaxID=1346330 RepID=U2J3H1_9SPHI|nr:DUF4374 domain-containing protein [Sphingobacterium paucimobilis]ERJ59494.1 hypothetical protein M472_11995 [Sphingobacterium paucimobilis HER1398]
MMSSKNNVFKSAIALLLCGSIISCSDKKVFDDERESNDIEFFISASENETASYLLAVPDITAKEKLTIKGKGMESDAYGSWLFPTPYVGIGLQYRKGDPGIGIGIALGPNGKIIKSGSEFQIVSRFTTYGVFQEKVLSVVEGIVQRDDKGNMDNTKLYSTFNFIDPANNNAVTTITKSTTNLTGNGEYSILSGVVQFGANNFLTALVPRQFKEGLDRDGKPTLVMSDTQYPDSVWIASFDKDLKMTKLYGDDRISYAAGRHRSQFYNTIGADDEGNLYAFAPRNAITSKASGVLKINKGASEFDKNYYWNLDEEVVKSGISSSPSFNRIHHVQGDYFIVEYLIKGTNPIEKDVPSSNALAIVNVRTKEFKWVKNIPDYNYYPKFHTPIADGGKFYVPVKEVDKLPAIYIIDPVTGQATKGLEVDAKDINGIGKLRKK